MPEFSTDYKQLAREQLALLQQQKLSPSEIVTEYTGFPSSSNDWGDALQVIEDFFCFHTPNPNPFKKHTDGLQPLSMPGVYVRLSVTTAGVSEQ